MGGRLGSYQGQKPLGVLGRFSRQIAPGLWENSSCRLVPAIEFLNENTREHH
jgi:hypothetical protein